MIASPSSSSFLSSLKQSMPALRPALVQRKPGVKFYFLIFIRRIPILFSAVEGCRWSVMSGTPVGLQQDINVGL